MPTADSCKKERHFAKCWKYVSAVIIGGEELKKYF
jgi:hypothetical protein